MNRQMKHMLATSIVVGTIKGVATALIPKTKEEYHQVEIDAINQVRFEEAVALYNTFNENTTDEQFAEYYRLMEPVK